MENNARIWYVYILQDPRNQAIRYVGWCFNIRRRFLQHIRRAVNGEKTHRSAWIRQLASLGIEPVIAEVESGSGSWAEAERRWIARLRSNGCDLTNATDGGEGVVGLVFSAASRAKMSAAKAGKPQSAEHVAKVAASLRGKPRPQHVKKIMAATRKGTHLSDETKAKLSAAIKGFKHTPEAKAKIAAAGTGRKHSEATKAKQRAAKVGRPLSAEHRRKLSQAKKGKSLSEEHKAKLRMNGGWKHTPEALAKITASRRARG